MQATAIRAHIGARPADKAAVTPFDAFPPDAPVTLIALGEAIPPPLRGRVIGMNGGTVLLSTAGRVAPGTSVRVEGNDTLLLGEICALQPDKDAWIVAVRIAHSLGSLAELDRLNRALLGDWTPRRVASVRTR
jgi:hypothetical protein